MAKHPNKRTIAIGSCQLPTGIIDRDYGLQNWHDLRRRENSDQLAAVVLLGDQIYSDPSAGLWDSKFLWEVYPTPYTRLLRFITAAGVSLPVISVPDDHEIIEGWEPIAKRSDNEDSSTRQKRFKLGMENYLDARLHDFCKPKQNQLKRGFLVKPPAGKKDFSDYDQNAERHLHHHRTVADTPLFMCNTRIEREHRHARNWSEANIIGETQFNDLCEWLSRQPPDKPKLIGSPAALLPRYWPGCQDQSANPSASPFCPGTLRSDSWDGFPNSLLRLLAFIADEQINHVIFLSGDLHFASVTQALIHGAGEPVVINSVHCSALYAPYALANARPEQFCLNDRFSFNGCHFRPSSGGQYRVESTTEAVRTGDGFCYFSHLDDNTVAFEFSRLGSHQRGSVRYTFETDRYQSVACIDSARSGER